MSAILRLTTAASLTVILSGCAALHDRHPGHHRASLVAGDPARPQVSLVDNRISVDPLIAYFPPGKGEVTITWQLPAGSKYSFTERGIVFEPRAGDEITGCKWISAREFSCINRHTRKGAYSYDITVTDGQRSYTWDPFVVNDM